MAISKLDRAKQFLPFDALKGFSDALRKKEIECEKRKILSEEKKEEIAYNLNKIYIGNIVKIIYYYNQKYIEYIGKVEKINLLKREIIFYDKNIIHIDDIFDIKIE
ncbi:MAG: YolD-like family protein [Clostridiales bacterium]|nr:YolD-like family protein [Clostridiales bacterium]